QYEGGVCDGHMIVTGAVPEQQFSTLIPYMMEKYGKNVYTLAADYNFGQISAEWVRKIGKENGGKMAGEEFIPLGVSQFSQSIQNIQKAKPDRSEEHTSELQSLAYLVCRLLLEKENSKDG